MNYALDNIPISPTKSVAEKSDVSEKNELTCEPNPFGSVSHIVVTLAQEGRIRLDVFDVTGRFIATIAWDRFSAGCHHFEWDGHDIHGRSVASGVYYYRMAVGSKELFRKTILEK